MKTTRKILKQHKHIQGFVAENISIESDEITCPYCYSLTTYIYGQDCKCEVCRQRINDGDLIYDNQ